MIFKNITNNIFTIQLDKAHLWTDSRQVPRMFRSQVDYVFRTVHLPNTKVRINPKEDCLEEYDEITVHAFKSLHRTLATWDYWVEEFNVIEFAFDHLTCDDKLAIVKLNDYTASDSAEILRCLSPGATTVASPSVIRPTRHMWPEFGDVNLRSPRGLTFDNQKHEIGLDWRVAFAYFFAKEKKSILLIQEGSRDRII